MNASLTAVKEIPLTRHNAPKLIQEVKTLLKLHPPPIQIQLQDTPALMVSLQSKSPSTEDNAENEIKETLQPQPENEPTESELSMEHLSSDTCTDESQESLSQHIIRLLAFEWKHDLVRLVFEYMPSNLHTLIRSYNIPFTESMIKRYMLMMLDGVAYIHKCRVMHRDLKPANILIDANGILKLADFGLAKYVKECDDRGHTHQVATRWYRAPEVLYGARNYTFMIDMWSIGCIFAEMWNRDPLFPGQNDIDQLYQVFQILGTPDEHRWPVSL